MEIKNLLSPIISGLACGALLALLMQYRDETIDKPSRLEKMRAFERKVFQDGEDQALQLAQMKQSAKLAAEKPKVADGK